MSKITPAKLTLEDFKEQRDWIGPLFSVLNSFTESIVKAFSNQLNVEDNLFQEIKEVKWRNSSGDFPLKFQTKFTANPKGLLPIFLFNNTLSANSTETPKVNWSYSDGMISISSITGLTTDSTYTIRLLLIYG